MDLFCVPGTQIQNHNSRHWYDTCLKSFLMENKYLPILHLKYQYHGCYVDILVVQWTVASAMILTQSTHMTSWNSGVALLCAFSGLLAHSNSKRHFEFLHFFFFSIMKSTYNWDSIEKKAHRHQPARPSMRTWSAIIEVIVWLDLTWLWLGAFRHQAIT